MVGRSGADRHQQRGEPADHGPPKEDVEQQDAGRIVRVTQGRHNRGQEI